MHLNWQNGDTWGSKRDISEFSCCTFGRGTLRHEKFCGHPPWDWITKREEDYHDFDPPTDVRHDMIEPGVGFLNHLVTWCRARPCTVGYVLCESQDFSILNAALSVTLCRKAFGIPCGKT